MKKDNVEEKSLDHLKKIEHELVEIKERTGGTWNSLRNGLLQGAGAVVGSILTVVFIGWLLSVLGVLPGFGQLGQSIQNAMTQLHSR
jgi:hypothetical protein